MLIWLVAFIWTIALELPIYALLIGSRLGRPALIIGTVVLVNATTHPLMTYLLHDVPALSGWDYLAECVVALAEGLICAAILHYRRAPHPITAGLRAAVIANVVSALASFPFAWIFAR